MRPSQSSSIIHIHHTRTIIDHQAAIQRQLFGEQFTNMPFRCKIRFMLSLPASIRWAHPLVAEWFVQRYATPTEPQEQGWPHVLAGPTTLISAPTGAGRPLTPFLA